MFDYEVIRSCRRTLSLCINREGKLIVRAPQRYSDRKIQQFVISKSSWIESHLKKIETRNIQFQDIYSYNNILINGTRYKLSFQSTEDPSVVYVPNLQAISPFLIKTYRQTFMERVDFYAQKLNVQPFSVGFRSYKSMWGICYQSGKIYYCTKLFMLPQYIQDYVIVHELCHLVHHDHSHNFWGLVATIVPNWKRIRADLHSYGFLLSLYP